MTGYSGTPLARKLGIGAESTVAAIGAPADYRALLAPLPDSVRITTEAGRSTDIAHVFATRRAELAERLTMLRETLGPQATLWVSWPKKASKVASEIGEETVRELALPLGFFDVKVCSVDAVWSGLKLVVRKELR